MLVLIYNYLTVNRSLDIIHLQKCHGYFSVRFLTNTKKVNLKNKLLAVVVQ